MFITSKFIVTLIKCGTIRCAAVNTVLPTSIPQSDESAMHAYMHIKKILLKELTITIKIPYSTKF